jgi:cell division topological specificity factor
MALLDFFLSRKKSTANIAKERLQIIVAERRRSDAEPHYLPQLRKDILEVICKYVQIDPEMVTVQLEQKDGVSPKQVAQAIADAKDRLV